MFKKVYTFLLTKNNVDNRLEESDWKKRGAKVRRESSDRRFCLIQFLPKKIALLSQYVARTILCISRGLRARLYVNFDLFFSRPKKYRFFPFKLNDIVNNRACYTGENLRKTNSREFVFITVVQIKRGKNKLPDKPREM